MIIRKLLLISLIFLGFLQAKTSVVSLQTQQDSFSDQDEILVTFKGLNGHSNEWMALYPAGSSHDYENIVRWVLTGGTVDGVVTFPAQKVGNYDIRVFQSANFVTSKQISVENGMPDTTVTTSKNTYSTEDKIEVLFENMSGDDKDWIGIYPIGSSNDWENVVAWGWTEGDSDGVKHFDALEAGNYDIRVFFHNSFTTEASTQIVVEEKQQDPVDPDTSVETTKQTYTTNEKIIAMYDNVSGGNEDWIAIYPAGSSNDWANMIQWQWTVNAKSGVANFNALPAGQYEVRVFLNNSFDTAASTQIVVEEEQQDPVDPDTSVETTKQTYTTNEKIIAMYDNVSGGNEDWIAIYPAGSSNDWANMIQWQWTANAKSGVANFNALPAGQYEVRVFLNNSFDLAAKSSFSVEEAEVTRILYDDFEDGIDPRWTRYFGREMTLLNVGAVDQKVGHTQRQVEVLGQKSLRTYNSDGLEESSGYIFDFENPDKKFKFLEVDMRIGESSHRFAFGVKIKTKLGDRKIEFASWLNHTLLSGEQIVEGPYGKVLENHRQAFTQDGILHVHPAPSDYFVGTGGLGLLDDALFGLDTDKFIHYKIDIEKILQVLEPENELEGITWFTTSGGDYDNLALSSN